MLNCWGANGSTWNILEPKWGPLFRLEFSPCVGGFLFLPKKEDNQVPDIYIYIYRFHQANAKCLNPEDVNVPEMLHATRLAVGSWKLGGFLLVISGVMGFL